MLGFQGEKPLVGVSGASPRPRAALADTTRRAGE
jgi:hypothetical protein